MMKTQIKKLKPNKRRFKINQKQLTVDYMSNLFRPKYSHDHKIINSDYSSLNIKKVINSQFDLYAEVSNSRRSKAVRLTEKLLSEVKEMLPSDFVFPTIIVFDFEILDIEADVIGGYYRENNVMYINGKYNTKEKISKFLKKNEGYFANTTVYAPFLHELGHKYYYDTIEKYSLKRNINYNIAEQIIRDKIADFVHERNENGNFLKKNLSKYAQDGYTQGKYTEIVAEAFSAVDTNSVAKEIVDLIGGILL